MAYIYYAVYASFHENCKEMVSNEKSGLGFQRGRSLEGNEANFGARLCLLKVGVNLNYSVC